ncbi:MAG: TolC family protein [Bacteroidota bacterium]|nr:TolC family protein [Bacteroidota bacterium]
MKTKKKLCRIVIALSGILLTTATCFSQVKDLSFFVSAAIGNSPLLADYRLQVATNQQDSLRIRAGYRPQVNASSLNSFAPVINGFGYDGAISNGGQLSALVGVNQSIVTKKNLQTQLDAVTIQNQGVNNTGKLSEQDISRSVTAQYITVYSDWLQLDFANSINALLSKEEKLLKELTKTNVYRQTDYLSFLVTMQQQELAAKQLRIQWQYDFAQLNYLAGIQDTATALLSAPDLRLQLPPQLAESAFFRKFYLDSLQLVNNRLLVDFSYKPKINLFADAGYNSAFSFQGYRNFGTSFGLSISIPIYDGHQRKIQYSKIALAERTRQGYQQFFTSQYRQQLAQFYQQLGSTAALTEDIQRQIKYAEGLINANIKLLETGDAHIPDLIIAINNYLSAKNLLTQNYASRMQIINQINYWNR